MKTGKEMIEIWALRQGESLKNPLLRSTGGSPSADMDEVDEWYVETAIRQLERKSPPHGRDVRLCLNRIRDMQPLVGEWWRLGRMSLEESARGRGWIQYYDFCTDKRRTARVLVECFERSLEQRMKAYPPVYTARLEDLDGDPVAVAAAASEAAETKFPSRWVTR